MNEADPLLGRTLAGRYRLISCLGRGSMSSVYLSRHVLIDRLSAIKVLREELTYDPNHKERFLREARAVNRINHPNIVEISDYGEAEFVADPTRGDRRLIVYLVMEYVPGETLAKLLLRGPLPETRLVPIALQIAAALARAHQTGVIHRDVKGENVLLVSRRDWVDLVKLTDFGVAKMRQLASRLGGIELAEQVVGTPGFVAPEYLLGETEIDGRADLYSLGVLMYEALTGALPFDASGAAELLTLPLTHEPMPLRQRRSNVSEGLAEIVMHCLRRRADDRPRDAFVLIDQLRAACPWAADLVIDIPVAMATRATSSAPVARSEPSRERQPPQPHPEERTSASLVLPARPPRWGEMRPESLGTAWRGYHVELDRRASVRGTTQPVALARARRVDLLDGLDRASARIGDRQRELDHQAARGRDFRATLGRAIDHLARDLSRAHSRVVELKTRRVQLHLRRRNTIDPGEGDALLWEEAAVDDELRKAQHVAADLGYQIATLQDELFRRNNGHEAEVLRTAGALEGEAAAMLAMHRELELITAELEANS